MLVRVICQTAFTISQKGFPFRRVIKQIFELEYNAGLKRHFTGTTGQKCRHEQVPLLEVYFCIVLNFWRSTSSPSGIHRNPTSWHLNGLTGPMHSHTANSCFQHHAPYLGDVSDWCYLHLPQCRRWRPESIPGQACFFLSIIAVQYLSVRQLHLHRPAWWGGFGHGRRARWHGDSERVFQMGLWERWDGGEKDISVPCWLLSSLWSFVPSGLAGSQTLMGLVWLCDCRKKKKHQLFLAWLG